MMTEYKKDVNHKEKQKYHIEFLASNSLNDSFGIFQRTVLPKDFQFF